jgi:hypothetical protein
MRGLSGLFRRIAMSFKHSAASRLLALSALASVALTTVAQAQMYGQGQGGQGGGFGNMMGSSLGWGMGSGMGGVGGIGVIVLALVVLGIAVMTFRRRTP